MIKRGDEVTFSKNLPAIRILRIDRTSIEYERPLPNGSKVFQPVSKGSMMDLGYDPKSKNPKMIYLKVRAIYEDDATAWIHIYPSNA